MAKEEEAAVDGKLDVGVGVVTHECVADGAEVRVPRAFGERPRGKRECVCEAVAESSPECRAVCIPCGSHCGRALSSQRGLVVQGGAGGGGGLEGGGSGLGGLRALLLEHVEQGRTPVHRLRAGAPWLVWGVGGGAWLGARELGPVHLPASIAWGWGRRVHVKGLVAAHPQCLGSHLLNLASRGLPWAHAGYVPRTTTVEAHCSRSGCGRMRPHRCHRPLRSWVGRYRRGWRTSLPLLPKFLIEDTPHGGG